MISKRALPAFIFIVMIAVVFFCIYILTYTELVKVPLISAYADLSNADFDKDIMEIGGEKDFYPNVLIIPEDFQSGKVPPSQTFDIGHETNTKFGTYRVRLKVAPGRTLGIAGKSADYSQEMFINGESMGKIGLPGVTKGASVPQSKFYTYFFEPDTEDVEIIVHYSNFNHRAGGWSFPLFLSAATNIEHMVVLKLVRVFLIFGCLLTVFILCFGLFILYGIRQYFLWFGLSCITMGMRNMFTGDKPIMYFSPDLDWYFAIAGEYCTLILITVFFCAYLNNVRPKMLDKNVIRVFYSFSAAYGLIVLFTSPSMYSKLLVYYLVVLVGFTIYVFVRLIMLLRSKKVDDVLMFIGGGILVLGGLSDMLYYSRLIPGYNVSDISQYTMMICIYIYMVVLAVQYSLTEAELSRIRVHQNELKETNLLLDKLNTLKTQYLANISHELKTPLAVMSIKAQMASKKLKKGLPMETINDELNLIDSESKRLSKIVTQIVTFNAANDTSPEKQELHIDEIIEKIVRMYSPILEKKGNSFQLDIAKNMPTVYGNADMISQVLINLLSNANRHTSFGEVTISARCVSYAGLNGDDGGKHIVVNVSDTGSGIDSKIMPRIFERHVIGEGGETGLGLTICKAIIEEHDGSISINSQIGKGSMVRFSLPVYMES